MKNETKSGSNAYISTEELSLMLMLVLCAFFKTVSIVSTDAASTVFYLNEPTGHFPQILIAIAVSVMVVWRLLIVFKDKSTLFPALFFFIAGGVSVLSSAVFLGIYWKTGSTPAFFNDFFMVWKEVFRVMVETAFWLAAIRFGVFSEKRHLLTVLSAMQIFSVLGAGLLINVFSCSMIVNYFTELQNNPDILTAIKLHPVFLLFWSGTLLLPAGMFLKGLNDNGSLPFSSAFEKTSAGNKVEKASGRKSDLPFSVFSALFAFTCGLYLYSAVSDEIIWTEEPLYRLRFYAALCAVLPPIIYFFKKAMLYIFLVLMIPGLIYVPFGCLILFPWILYAKEAALLASDSSVKATIRRKSFIEPVALASSGVVLLFLRDRFTTMQISVQALLLLIFTVIAGFVLASFYRRKVLAMLKTHSWRGERLFLKGRAIRRWLRDALDDTDSRNVLYALNVIEASFSAGFDKAVKKALHHKNDDLRLYALTKIEELDMNDLLSEVVNLAQTDESDAVRRVAVRVMCRLGGAEERGKALSLIDDPVVREGALAGLLAVGREGVFTAVKNVADLSVSENREDRLTAAEALGYAGNRAFCQPLTALLEDPDPDVCKAALKAAGKLTEPALLPAVMKTFCRPETTEDATDTLSRFKETAFDAFDGFLLSAGNPVELRVRLIRLVAEIDSPEAEKFLFDHLRIEDRRIRFNIIKALTSAGFKATGKNINAVRLCLYDEMEQATGFLAAIETLDQNKKEELKVSVSLLIDALNKEIEFIKERILLFLALLYPPKTPTESEAGKTGADIIGSIPSEELKSLCLPLFEDIPASHRLALLRPQFYPPVLSFAGYVREILETPAGETDVWTRACAAYVAGGLKDPVFANALTALLSDPDDAVREAAVWAIGKTEEGNADRPTENSGNDSADNR